MLGKIAKGCHDSPEHSQCTPVSVQSCSVSEMTYHALSRMQNYSLMDDRQYGKK